MHTEDDLPGEIEIANLLNLVRYRPTAYAHAGVNRALARLCAQSTPDALPLQLLHSMLMRQLGLPAPVVRAALCHLLWHATLTVDLSQRLFDEHSFTDIPVAFHALHASLPGVRPAASTK